MFSTKIIQRLLVKLKLHRNVAHLIISHYIALHYYVSHLITLRYIIMSHTSHLCIMTVDP